MENVSHNLMLPLIISFLNIVVYPDIKVDIVKQKQWVTITIISNSP